MDIIVKENGYEMKINIVSFDIPYPPDYGGVIDIYYKIKALNSVGIKIYLHCFYYGRKRSFRLESICSRNISLANSSYIVVPAILASISD